MVCAKVQILVDVLDGNSEIKIEVADDGKSVMISSDDTYLNLVKEDFSEFIIALMAADAYMDRLARSNTQHLDIRVVKNTH